MPRLVHPTSPRATRAPRAPRAPASPRERRTPPPPPGPPGEEVALRLAIGRDGIGLELARPARLGCLAITELSATLPGLRFPVDVSGGVPRFRHRRGELQRMEVELGARALERFAAPRLRGILGTRTPEVWVRTSPRLATACVSSPSEPDDDSVRDMPVLAFDVHVLAEDGDLVLVVGGARGTALPAPASALAIACVEALLRGVAERQGAAFVLRHAAGALARTLLPEAGARVPACDDVRWISIAAQGDTWILHAMGGALAATPDEDALRAREAAGVLRETDEALVAGDLTAARGLALEALDRAPRHPEIVRRILEIDARAGGRAEGALAMLVEARRETDARFGTLPGELLAETGDMEAAIASLERAGDTDPAPALAARALEIAARLVRDPDDAARWLDRAVARAPRSAAARWARVARRLELGRLEDALADVEHLEAMARGNRAKHVVWLRAGRAWREAGQASRAGALFERALRYVPEEPRAMAGLGVALVEDGREARGVAVLARALEIARERRAPTSRLLLDLGRALAEALDDLPTAIAHVSSIPTEAPEAPIARGLEGRWRARLGDMAGAVLAFARLRELATSLPSGGPVGPSASPAGPHAPSDDAGAEAIATLLGEAAAMEREQLNDPLAAQRHLAAALRLRPHDALLLRAYRDVGAQLAGHLDPDTAEAEAGSDDFPEAEAPSATHRTSIPEGSSGGPTAPPWRGAHPTERPLLDLSLAAPEEDADAAARVEELTRRVQANPKDDAVVDELLEVLESLGRGHELLALVTARLEDATPERRAVLAPRARAALTHLAAEAEAAGRHGEAALYRDVLSTLPGD